MARQGRGRRSLWPRAVLLVLAVTLLVGGWVGIRGYLAQQHLLAARATLADVPDALVDRRLEDARDRLASAGDRTRRARSLTGDPVWRLTAAVPYLGRTAATVRGLTAASDDFARSVLPQALSATERLDPAQLRGPDGTVDVALLASAAPPVTASADEAQQVLAALERLPAAGAVAPVEAAHAQLEGTVREAADVLDGAATALEIAPALLGTDRPRRYFVMVQQAAESRGTGGLLGGFAVIEAAGGRLSTVTQGSNRDLPRPDIGPAPGTPEDFVRRYGPLGTFTALGQVNLSPDLPVVGRQVAARWQAATGQDVDGVVALDAVAIAALLRGSDPIELPSGRRLPPADVLQFLSVGQYEGDTTSRKDELGDIAAVAIGRLAAGEGDSVQLLRGLVDAVRSGHLRMTSDDPVLQPTLAEAGVDGALPGPDRPLAYLVLTNATGSKLDQFLDRSLTYELGECAQGRRESTITVGLRSDPPAGLPPYVTLRAAGGGTYSSSLENVLGVSVYGTAGARLVRAALDGQPVSTLVGQTPLRLHLDEEAGLPIWQVYLDLPPGQARELVLTVDEPVLDGPPRTPVQPLLRPLSAELRNSARDSCLKQ